MLSTSLCRTSTGMRCHPFCNISFRWTVEFGHITLDLTRWFNLSQRCSIWLRSGLCVGQSSSVDKCSVGLSTELCVSQSIRWTLFSMYHCIVSSFRDKSASIVILEVRRVHSMKSPFLLQRKDPLVYIILLAPDSTTDIPPFMPEVVEYLCHVGGGFLIVEQALSIAFVGNAINRNINGCWNAVWFSMLGYYILMESFNLSGIIIQPTHLNLFKTGLRGDRISNW